MGENELYMGGEICKPAYRKGGGGFRLVNDNVIYLEVAIAVLRYLSRNSDARSTVRHAEAEFVDTETQGKFLMGGS